MTDDLWTPLTPATPTGAGLPRLRHWWVQATNFNGPLVVCGACGAVRDETAARRGKSARRLGGDQERRIERRFGPTKIGERGDPVDHIGRDWRWQSKATRADPPRWLAAVIGPTWRATLPASITGPLRAMDGLYGDRRGVVIRSYVRQGVATRDYLFVDRPSWGYWVGFARSGDWMDSAKGFVIVPGADWLDIVGRDEGGTG